MRGRVPVLLDLYFKAGGMKSSGKSPNTEWFPFGIRPCDFSNFGPVLPSLVIIFFKTSSIINVAAGPGMIAFD